MRLAFLLHIESEPKARGGCMSDWIDELKVRREDALRSKEVSNEIRLRNDELIKAKSPTLWAAVIDQVKQDCAELNKTFSDDSNYQAQFTKESESAFVIETCTRPGKGIRARLDSTNLFAHVEVLSRESILHPIKKMSDEITFDLNSERDVCARYKDRTHILVANISRALLEELLGLRH
jgi:hypothetical protein